MGGVSCVLWTLLLLATVWVCLDLLALDLLDSGGSEEDSDGPEVASMVQSLESAPPVALEGGWKKGQTAQQ